jgi:hypothetical protein
MNIEVNKAANPIKNPISHFMPPPFDPLNFTMAKISATSVKIPLNRIKINKIIPFSIMPQN